MFSSLGREYKGGVAGPAFYGFGHAVDASSRLLFTQSQSQPVRVLDLSKNKSLPALEGTSGTELLCMHFDSASNTLGAIVNKTTTMELVRVDTASGAISTALSWDSNAFPGALELFRHDDKAASPPLCTFDQTSGTLAMLLFERDANSLPGFDHKDLFVATLNVRGDPESGYPSKPQKVTMPFRSDKPLGNRTWRALQPTMSFL